MFRGLAAAERLYEASLSDVRQAEADAANAATEEVRYRELVAKDEVSHEMYDQRATASRSIIVMKLDQQARLWGYIDDFRYMTLICLLCVPLTFIMKKASTKGAAAG